MSNPEGSQNTVDTLPALAADFVEACKAAGISLDYLPRTLPLVDRFLAAKRSELQHLAANTGPEASDLQTTISASITAYLGEVIRRETGGRWYDFDGRPMLDVGEYQADPAPIVAALLATGQAREGDVPIASTKAYCEMIVRMQRVWLEGTVLSTYESMAALRTAIAPDAKLAGTIVAQSQLAVQTGKLTFDESLDFSSDSLDAVERIMSALHKRAREGPPDQQLADEQVSELSRLWGIYVGEVIRRYYGGQWTMVDGVPELALGGRHAGPLAKVRQRIADGPMHNLKYYFQSIMKVLTSQQSS